MSLAKETCLEKEVRRGRIPRPKRTQVVPSSPADDSEENDEKIDKNVDGDVDRRIPTVDEVLRRSTSIQLLHKASRESCFDCLLLFVRDFNLCCDSIYDFTMSTQSKGGDDNNRRATFLHSVQHKCQHIIRSQAKQKETKHFFSLNRYYNNSMRL